MDTPFFDFSLASRNAEDQLKGKHTRIMSTGTTIVGLIFDKGVVIAADTRATAGTVVADRTCIKIEAISDKIYCAGAGTAADTFAVKQMARSELRLLRLEYDMEDKVEIAGHLIQEHLFRYQGHVSAALIIGGVDDEGFHLISLEPHGSASYLPYHSLGSGSLAARAILCDSYSPNMVEEDAIELASRAITGGIMNDLASGEQVDVCVMTEEGARFIRGYKQPGKDSVSQTNYV